jgi:hypothetical protein
MKNYTFVEGKKIKSAKFHWNLGFSLKNGTKPEKIKKTREMTICIRYIVLMILIPNEPIQNNIQINLDVRMCLLPNVDRLCS